MFSQSESTLTSLRSDTQDILCSVLVQHRASICNCNFRRRPKTNWTTRPTFSLAIALILLVDLSHADSKGHGPCLGCLLFSERHLQSSHKDKKESEVCHYPCQCQDEPKCQDGVSVVRDGCGCCYMCAKQLGHLCSPRDLCDVAKDLSCESWDQNTTGVCKGPHQKPCFIDGIMFKDGEQFQPECSQLCTCQNGFYGCVSVCPQESQMPSELTCHKPKLIEVKNKCCKEWTCQKVEGFGSLALTSNGLKSDNLLQDTDSTPPQVEEVTPLAATVYQSCHKKTTDWTPCSVTCDVGVSVRIVVDPVTCNNYSELHLCYFRPCGASQETGSVHKKCTPTTPRDKRHHIQYQDCMSVKLYRLKFCSTCKKNKCCFPSRVKIHEMEFQCSDGKREIYSYMWIKRCRCDTVCDGRPNFSSRRRHGKGRARKWKRRYGRRRRTRYKG